MKADIHIVLEKELPDTPCAFLTCVLHFLSPVIETSEILRDICSGFYIINYDIPLPLFLSAPRANLGAFLATRVLRDDEAFFVSFILIQDYVIHENLLAQNRIAVGDCIPTGTPCLQQTQLSGEINSGAVQNKFGSAGIDREPRCFLNIFTCAKSRIQLDELLLKYGSRYGFLKDYII